MLHPDFAAALHAENSGNARAVRSPNGVTACAASAKHEPRGDAAPRRPSAVALAARPHSTSATLRRITDEQLASFIASLEDNDAA